MRMITQKTILIGLVIIFIFSACTQKTTQQTNHDESQSSGTASAPTSTFTPTANQDISPTPTESPTEIEESTVVTLIDQDLPYLYENRSNEYKSFDIYGSRFTVDEDVSFTIDISVESISEESENPSTGFILAGYPLGDGIQIFNLTYQDGYWSAGYKLDWRSQDFEVWESYTFLKSPHQTFTIEILENGKKIKIKNDDTFSKSLISYNPDKSFFKDSLEIIAQYQVGPSTSLKVNKLTAEGITYAKRNYPRQPQPPELIPTPDEKGSSAYVFHISPSGDDTNPGSAGQPFATFSKARDTIRAINDSMAGDIQVILHGGAYQLTQPWVLTEADSGKNGFDVIYRAAEGEQPILSGGVQVTGWEQVQDSKLWTARLEDVEDLRQLYVNETRAKRAASKNTMTGLQWTAGDYSDRDGIRINASLLPDIQEPSGLELHWIYDWKDMRLLVESIEDNGDGTVTLWMKQPYYANALAMGDTDPNHQWIPGYDIPFILENDLSLVDEPGEWYYDQFSQKIYYYPKEEQELGSTEFIIPQITSLLEISGQDVQNEAHNLVFEGITFAYAGWTRANKIGTFGWQSQNLLGGSIYLDSITPGSVAVDHAREITFNQCQFTHLGAAGLHLDNNVHDTVIEGNLFKDISDSALVVGHWDHNYITAPNIQAPTRYSLIKNNLIIDVGIEYWGAPAISAFYVNNLEIVNNEIRNAPYTGISLGWGWQYDLESTTCYDNLVSRNLIQEIAQIARDAGGVYTLGQQPGTRIEGNVVRNMKNDYACLYTDEGSAFITLANNVCDSTPEWMSAHDPSIHNNQFINNFTNIQRMRNNGTDIVIENTTYVSGQAWPEEALSIIDNAGLEPGYQYLHDWVDVD